MNALWTIGGLILALSLGAPSATAQGGRLVCEQKHEDVAALLDRYQARLAPDSVMNLRERLEVARSECKAEQVTTALNDLGRIEEAIDQQVAAIDRPTPRVAE